MSPAQKLISGFTGLDVVSFCVMGNPFLLLIEQPSLWEALEALRKGRQDEGFGQSQRIDTLSVIHYEILAGELYWAASN